METKALGVPLLFYRQKGSVAEISHSIRSLQVEWEEGRSRDLLLLLSFRLHLDRGQCKKKNSSLIVILWCRMSSSTNVGWSWLPTRQLADLWAEAVVDGDGRC